MALLRPTDAESLERICTNIPINFVVPAEVAVAGVPLEDGTVSTEAVLFTGTESVLETELYIPGLGQDFPRNQLE